MPYQKLQIKDIYLGSIDAKDDYNLNQSEFIDNFYKPSTYDIDSLITGDSIFIEGLKGTGKTALLYYMKNLVETDNMKSDLILFRSDYDDVIRRKIEKQNGNIIQIDKVSDIETNNFTYIWKLIFLSKIIQLNYDSQFSIYPDSKDLTQLTKMIRILITQNRSKGILKKIMDSFKGTKVTTYAEGHYASIGFEFDWSAMENQLDLADAINQAMDVFKKINVISATKPAYIFIDELEAYLDDVNVFKRDLTLIRDLLLTIKEIGNITFNKKVKNIKFICAVRSEILDSIDQNIASKELNKSIYSFKHVLKWNYTNTNAIKHPVFQIWIKRIKNAEIKYNNEVYDDQEILSKWFVEDMYGDKIIQYIIHNTWNKPRDIVRFMQSAKNVDGKRFSYDQYIFENLRREYSRESWKDISEELNAKYNKNQIDDIKHLLTGFISIFTFKQVLQRADFHSKTRTSIFIKSELDSILQTLFRIGVIGNISIDKTRHRWSHKGDESLLIDDPNFLIEIHYALHNDLSIVKIQRNSISHLDEGEVFKCLVEKTYIKYVKVVIEDIDVHQSIKISDLHLTEYIKDLREYYSNDDRIYTRVYFDKSTNQKRLERIEEKEFEEFESKTSALIELYSKYKKY